MSLTFGEFGEPSANRPVGLVGAQVVGASVAVVFQVDMRRRRRPYSVGLEVSEIRGGSGEVVVSSVQLVGAAILAQNAVRLGG